jgi:multiple sugar transport system substrate-binding protein
MSSVCRKGVRHLSVVALLWVGVCVSVVSAADKQYIDGTFPPLLAGKPYAGTTIKVPMMKGWACFQPAINLHKDFEELTGIKVELDLMPGPEIPTKQLLEVSQKTRTYDLIAQGATTFGSFFKWTVPMDDRIKEVWGSIEKFEEWLFPAQLGVKGKDGHHYFLPFHANVQIGYYRKNLLEDPQEQAAFKAKYGYELAAPKTMKEVEDIAAFFTRPAQSLYGLTSNWGFGAGFGTFMDMYQATGNNWLDNWYRPTFKSGEPRKLAVQIAQWQVDAIYTKKFVNPDAINFATGQVSDYFMGGASAMAYGWLSDYWGYMQKPAVQAKIGPVGTFRFPSFNGADAGGMTSWWVMGINQDSKHPDAAWEYIKWVLNEHQQLPMAVEGGQLPPMRALAYKTSVEPGGINPRAMYEAFQKARIMIQVPELSQAPFLKARELHRDLMAKKVTAEQFVDELADATEKALQKAGYYK